MSRLRRSIWWRSSGGDRRYFAVEREFSVHAFVHRVDERSDRLKSLGAEVFPGDFPGNGVQRLIDDAGSGSAERIPRDLSNPYNQQWNLSIQQEMGVTQKPRRDNT